MQSYDWTWSKHRISQLEDDDQNLQESANKSPKNCEELHQAIEDAANRDRRQNLRSFLFKEKLETK